MVVGQQRPAYRYQFKLIGKFLSLCLQLIVLIPIQQVGRLHHHPLYSLPVQIFQRVCQAGDCFASLCKNTPDGGTGKGADGGILLGGFLQNPFNRFNTVPGLRHAGAKAGHNKSLFHQYFPPVFISCEECGRNSAGTA